MQQDCNSVTIKSKHMQECRLSPRKPDLLDELNALRRRRGIAYRTGSSQELEAIHLEMKDFWLRNGWSLEDASNEYLNHVRECAQPYAAPKGNQSIKYSVVNNVSGQHIFLKSIARLSDYWLNKG